MIAPESEWVSQWDNLPVVSDNTWAQNIADMIESLASGLKIAPPIVLSGDTWAWQKGTFKSAIESMVPVMDKITSAQMVAMAWQSATMASTYSASAGFIGVPAPPTLWAGPPTIAINSASVAAAYATLFATLSSLEPTAEKGNNPIPKAFRAAFAAIMFDLSGQNSIPPPAGPLPLNAPMSAVE